MQTADKGFWNVEGRVEKYGDYGMYVARKAPLEVVEFERNVLLNEGINRLLNLLTGVTTSPYNNANARIGVGNGTTAAAATQTGLVGATTLFKGMEASYPAVSGTTVTFRSVFADAEANFAWNEWSIDNGNAPNHNLNRRQVSMGTKDGGTWTITVDITIT